MVDPIMCDSVQGKSPSSRSLLRQIANLRRHLEEGGGRYHGVVARQRHILGESLTGAQREAAAGIYEPSWERFDISGVFRTYIPHGNGAADLECSSRTTIS